MKYKQYNNTDMYLAEDAEQSVSYGWYFAKNNSAEAPDSLNLTASWNTYLGYYFFLSEPIELTNTKSLDDLAAALLADETLQQPKHTGAIWLSNAVAPLIIPARLDTKLKQEQVVLSEIADLGFGTYKLPLEALSPVNLDTSNQELQIGYPTVEGAQQAASDQGVRIAVVGEQFGIARGEVIINDFSSDPHTGWSAGFKYNMTNGGALQSQFYPMLDTEAGHYTLFKMLWDPLHPLDGECTSLSFTGIGFGLKKVDETIDQFEIANQEHPNLFDSWWRTLYGEKISLRPILTGVRAAQFVFQKCANQGAQETAYYLTPKGDFELCIPGKSEQQFKLLCGLAGTECLTFTAGEGSGDIIGDVLRFYPNQGAYSNDYPVVRAVGDLATVLQSDVSENLLDTTYMSAWGVVVPTADNPKVIYYVAPESASLYKPSSTQGLLDAYYAETAQFTSEEIEANQLCFPMVPYAGLEYLRAGAFPAKDIEDFELQIIGAARKEVIGYFDAQQPIKEVLDDVPTTLTATPQGLLATIQGTNWKKVLLAQNEELDEDFAFVNLPNVLRNALQTNELFLVVSDGKHLGDDFQKSIGIEGWTFNVDVSTRIDGLQQAEPANIMLFKFRKGTILELIQDVNAWTNSLDFNYNEGQRKSVQTWLVEYCNDAIGLAQTNSRYEHFAQLIQDPNWYGILSLKVDIDLGAFPKDLKGLLGAMDLNRFDAHHVGIQVNYIQPETGDGSAATGIKVEKSNLFALISYIDPSYKVSQDSGDQDVSSFAGLGETSMEQVTYAYKVLTLQVVFANSAITNFESKLRLTARQWFDENASLNKPKTSVELEENEVDDPANYAILFNGHYESHEGHKTYTFLTQKGLYYQYFMESAVLNYVEFVKAQFNTLSSLPQSPGSDIEHVISVFTFYGYMNLKQLEDFDCLSYGSELGQETVEGKGLYFSNMALDVSFNLDIKNSVTSDLVFTFNPKNMAFDQSLSTVRSASLGQAFPLSPHAILMGGGDNTPAKLGYIHIVPPTNFIPGSLGDAWYGLDLELHWGGPGALADQAGFTPHILMAWSPGSTLNMELLIRLPGMASGGKTLSLQNVLKLKVGSFRFTITEQENNKISYNLLLNSIALSLIGLKFPPNGNTNLMLLGDPDEPGSMGWYGVYSNPKTSKSNKEYETSN